MGSYDKIIGALLLGVFVNTFLYGLVTYQFAVYYRTNFNDTLVIKSMVLFLFVLDTFHSGSVIYMAWYYAVKNYNNPAALAVANWPHTFTPLATALAALVTHTFLAFRIWRFTKSKVLYGLVMLLAVPVFVLGVTLSIEVWTIRVLSEMPRVAPLGGTWLSMQVVVDMFITITLVTVLSRSRTGFRRTDTILNRFIRGAVQTGLFASLFALSDLIMSVLFPGTNMGPMFAIPMGRVYTNTLLDTLLARKKLLEVVGNDVPELGATRGATIDSVYWPPVDTQFLPPTTTPSGSAEDKV